MTARIEMANVATAGTATRELFQAVQDRFQAVPNIFRMIGTSEAGLAAIVGFQAGMDRSTLPAALREQIALAVSEVNGCQYCLSAHAAIGRLVGLDRNAITAAREARASDAKAEAALEFARAIVETRGHVSEPELAAVRAAGYTDAEVVEIVAQVIHDTFTNYVAIATQTPSEFPPVQPLVRRAA